MSQVKRFRADHRHVVETEFDDAQFVSVADYDALQQRLTVAEQRAGELERLLRDAEDAHGKMLMSDPPQEAWKYHRISERISAALKPSESSSPVGDQWEK